jgi:proton-dependent oligopeptide transporter, POT family
MGDGGQIRLVPDPQSPITSPTSEPFMANANIGTTTTDSPPPGLEQYQMDTSFFGHPRGLNTLFFTEMWERFSFYGIRPMLLAFMALALVDGGFGFSTEAAGAILGIYAGSVYLSSLPGGWIADRWLGLRQAIWYGGLLIALGHLLVAFSGILGRPVFFIGLVSIVCGTGLLKPNISACVGELYTEKGARRDAGFSIFYMGINLGATLGPLVTGALRQNVGFHWGFGAAGVGMLAGVITYRMRAGSTLGPIGLGVSATPEQTRKVKIAVGVAMAILIAVIAAASLGVMTIDPIAVSHNLLKFQVGLAAAYFAYLFFFAGLNKDEIKRSAVIAVLFVFAAIFWAGFEQAPSSLNTFADKFTNRMAFGREIPYEWLQTVNSIFVVLGAPVFAWLWVTLGRRNIVPSSPMKFSAGLLLGGLGFLIMMPAVNSVVASGGAVKVSMIWLIMSYILQTAGELSLSPVGLSSMTKLAPARFSGQMMGVWFLAASVGNLIAGIVGGHVDPGNLDAMPKIFGYTTAAMIGAAVVLALLIVPIRNMMKDSSAAGGH